MRFIFILTFILNNGKKFEFIKLFRSVVFGHVNIKDEVQKTRYRNDLLIETRTLQRQRILG
ncbi:hypothetical protein BpHYR1_051737 [Brachionus plicatilis]|uniref:Uncharacterized protein n=1 Tax=Brachionus plicatilis TaxID=10195 RepID=A0A3M7PPM6_BRAPC|nr:hypothetical protein BpHYR1_051737 [Brachionus plicatilis]